MPIGRYFKGKGQSVMQDMKDRYGENKGESLFYATANKNPEMKPADNQEPKKRQSFGARIARGAHGVSHGGPPK